MVADQDCSLFTFVTAPLNRRKIVTHHILDYINFQLFMRDSAMCINMQITKYNLFATHGSSKCRL